MNTEINNGYCLCVCIFQEYTKIAAEAARKGPTSPPANWPSHGRVSGISPSIHDRLIQYFEFQNVLNLIMLLK
jgi:hypothetical protein